MDSTKWGAQAVAGEPVAWLRNTTDPQPHAVTNLKYRSAEDARAGVEYIPVFAAPQPVAREPLSAAQKQHIHNETGAGHALICLVESYLLDARGIKGGQHGDATPQPTQPVAREPLTDEQIQDLLLCGNPTDEEMRLIRIGWDAAHGIKGGQHVS